MPTFRFSLAKPFLCLLAVALFETSTLAQEQTDNQTSADAITLDRIMSDPQWIGRSPSAAYFADDGKSIFYQQQRADSVLSDWFEMDLSGNLIRRVEDKDQGTMDSRGGQWSSDHQRKLYDQSGDLFIKNLKTGKLRQLTKTKERESSPQFMANENRIMFRRGNAILVRDLRSGLEEELVDLSAGKDPQTQREKRRETYLTQQQQDLFEVLRDRKEDSEERREAFRESAAADKTRLAPTWYLDSDREIGQVSISPNAKWAVVVLESKQQSRGQNDVMPEFVDESGYVQSRNVRPLVGTGKAAPDQLLLLNLKTREKFVLGFDSLPQFDDDPMVPIREAAKQWRAGRKAEAQPESEKPTDNGTQDPNAVSADSTDAKPDSDKPEAHKPASTKNADRAIQTRAIRWNTSGDQLAVELYSADNKDRWLAAVNFKDKKLDCFMHRRDPAWINRGMGTATWLPDNQSIYYLTEEEGYAHLYLYHVPSKAKRQLTRGDFVVDAPQASHDGKYIYYQANAKHPGIYEIYRVEVASGEIQQLTDLGGSNDYALSDDQKNLLITHSSALTPPELWIQPLDSKEPARQITQTVSGEFTNLPWVAPQFVTVPSRAGRPIHARVYLPPNHDPSKQYPAVIFIHGAGYLQNAHQGWSSYFREFMFHSLLAHRGFVVLDMDYRGSAGYGRDWRTAIYRQMGHPEVEDLEDGKRWMSEHHSVDPQRVGIYGGSYGGFLTMMGLFRRPGVFACGAALRPVTDWAHYNHGYTSNILNTPEDDPEAYAVSSPIEFAEGLEDPLLICHGMVDDNVFFKDTVRLAQRLIELKKDQWEVAIYPVEPHGFVEPTSWYDEYRRILELFEENLKPESTEVEQPQP